MICLRATGAGASQDSTDAGAQDDAASGQGTLIAVVQSGSVLESIEI